LIVSQSSASCKPARQVTEKTPLESDAAPWYIHTSSP
jgi:hypothetical protein